MLPMLDIAIGLIFIYLFLSLVCTVMAEWISRFLLTRSNYLEAGIRNLLNDLEGDGLVKTIYEHPLITGIGKGSSKPSYIPPHTFARVLMDIISPANIEEGSKKINQFKTAIAQIPNEPLKKSLLPLLGGVEQDLNEARKRIEQWYDDSMERVSGWYKRKSQVIILVLSIIITILFNADTITIVKKLYTDEALRAGIVKAAEVIVKEETAKRDQLKKDESQNSQEMNPNILLKELKDTFESENIRLPLGWKGVSSVTSFFESFFKSLNIVQIVGWLFTAFAVSLGAPFWFDTLNKFVNIRSVGKKPEKAK